jgi:hypothetical protein
VVGCPQLASSNAAVRVEDDLGTRWAYRKTLSGWAPGVGLGVGLG